MKEHEAYKLIANHDYLNRFVERTLRDLSKANDIVKELRLVLKGEAGERVAVSAQQVMAQAWERYSNDLHTDDRENVWRLNDSGVPADAWLLGSESILRSIFWNLISNACKAMPQGGTVVVQVRADAAEDKYVLAEVRDAGVGIEPWRIEHIWDPNDFWDTQILMPKKMKRGKFI